MLLVLFFVLALAPGSATAQADGESDTAFEPGSPSYERLERSGFFRRRARGEGWFLTRYDPLFQRRRLSDVLRGAPGVNVDEGGGGARVSNARSGRTCPYAVFVDGTYTSIRNIDELTAEDVDAIEVYRGPAEVPLAYRAPSYDRTCGALLVWTRIEVDE